MTADCSVVECPKCGRVASISVETQGTYLICDACARPTKVCECEKVTLAERYPNQVLPDGEEQ